MSPLLQYTQTSLRDWHLKQPTNTHTLATCDFQSHFERMHKTWNQRDKIDKALCISSNNQPVSLSTPWLLSFSMRRVSILTAACLSRSPMRPSNCRRALKVCLSYLLRAWYGVWAMRWFWWKSRTGLVSGLINEISDDLQHGMNWRWKAAPVGMRSAHNPRLFPQRTCVPRPPRQAWGCQRQIWSTFPA